MSRLRSVFGRATRIDRTEIRWPTGETEVVQNVGLNEILTITEGKGITARVPLTGAPRH